MHPKLKSQIKKIGAPLALVAVTTFLVLPEGAVHNDDAFCGGVQSITLDYELPVSHPKNRCASQQLQGVSWKSWFIGRSSSYQFHFIDLLELLSRSKQSSPSSPAQSK